jgi:hypothetical protein
MKFKFIEADTGQALETAVNDFVSTIERVVEIQYSVTPNETQAYSVLLQYIPKSA